MAFLPSLSAKELQRYHRVVTRAVEVRSHLDILAWLQGDMQRYLPHDILVAAWGDFQHSQIQHDIVSAMAGVRSQDVNTQAISPLLLTLFERWTQFGKRPFSLNAGESGFLLQDSALKNAVGMALQTMRSAMVHGISDERGSHDCLYVVFSAKETFGEPMHGAMAVVLPYIDTALRQVKHLPHQSNGRLKSNGNGNDNGYVEYQGNTLGATGAAASQDCSLSQREAEVLHWVARGKTNPEIAMILDISAFTVKNHMQRVFKKLDVTNRAQAVSKYRPAASHVQV